MASNFINIETYRGDDNEFNFAIKNINKIPIDITGWKFSITIKRKTSQTDDDADFKKDVTTHTSPTLGLTKILLTHAETDGLVGIYQYDIQYKSSSTTYLIKTLMRGTISFIDDVTRRN